MRGELINSAKYNQDMLMDIYYNSCILYLHSCFMNKSGFLLPDVNMNKHGIQFASNS